MTYNKTQHTVRLFSGIKPLCPACRQRLDRNVFLRYWRCNGCHVVYHDSKTTFAEFKRRFKNLELFVRDNCGRAMKLRKS